MMKLWKWLYRYALLAAVFALDLVWILLCRNKTAQLEAYADSTDFMRLSLDSFKDAVEVLDRIKYYNGLYRYGIIAGIVIAAAFVLLVLWHILGKRLLKKSAKAKKATDAAIESPKEGKMLLGGDAQQKTELFDTIGEMFTDDKVRQKHDKHRKKQK